MRFLFFVSGWDGCASDASMYNNACLQSHLANAILQMQALVFVMHFLFPIEAHNTTWQNGHIGRSSNFYSCCMFSS
jgi:hypothetical protein